MSRLRPFWVGTSAGLLCLSVVACSSPPDRATSDIPSRDITSDRPPTARPSSPVDAAVAAPTPAEVAAAAHYRQLGLGYSCIHWRRWTGRRGAIASDIATRACFRYWA
ncbi:MAG: hypothetical protein AAGE92_03595, partial [Cyanobacteria bacterium P01_G01_bin.4]